MEHTLWIPEDGSILPPNTRADRNHKAISARKFASMNLLFKKGSRSFSSASSDIFLDISSDSNSQGRK
jgi:hypothetical protein